MEGSILPGSAPHAPRLSRAAAIGAAAAVGIASAVLLVFSVLVAALTCGDDGPLDYGTGNAATELYCRTAFDGTSNFTAGFTAVGVLALGAVVVTGAVLAATRRRGWLYGSLAVLALLGMWTVAVLAVV